MRCCTAASRSSPAPASACCKARAATPKKTGDFGLSARWSPEWLDGTAGLYARRTADIQPQLALLPAVAAGVPAAGCARAGLRRSAPPPATSTRAPPRCRRSMAGQVGQYRAFYGRDIDIYGLSLAKNVAGISVGAELSYRHNMPLQSVPVQVLPARAGQPGHRAGRRTQRARRRRARRARQHHARRVQPAGHRPQDAAVRRRHLERRTGVEPLDSA